MSRKLLSRRSNKKLTKKQKSKVSDNLEKRIDKLREENALEATVISHMGYNIITQIKKNSSLVACDWRQNIGAICAGDKVLFSPPKNDEKPIIEAVLPRETVIEKQNSYRGAKPFAANIDQILVIITHEPLFQPSLIDRYVIMANMVGIDCLIYFNKIDILTEPNIINHVNRIQNIYESIPDIHWVKGSIKTERGLVDLKKQLSNRQTVITGQSGVGKSSLINTLIPDMSIQTMSISEASGLGRHSTTNSTLYRLDERTINEGIIIDTPGVRSFDTYHLNPAQIEKGFAEIYPFIGQCQFSDCSHTHENNCALKSAINDEKISKLRYASFLQILKESQDHDK